MISYKPLCSTLQRKGKDVQYLSSVLKVDTEKLREILNSGKELSLARLFKICIDLECELKDIVQWVEFPSFVNIDWKKISKPLTLISIESGLHRSTLCNAKRYRKQVRIGTAKKIAKVLGCKVEDIVC